MMFKHLYEARERKLCKDLVSANVCPRRVFVRTGPLRNATYNAMFR
jgi:hypothetical protein